MAIPHSLMRRIKKQKYKTSILHVQNKRGRFETMPEEIKDVDKFIEISERAHYCNIKRLKKTVKLKLRTAKKLYTLKVEPTNAEEVIKKLHCEIREI
jgi:hypothetical protein